MAGHSKWANIKHRKGRQDALRGKQNTKLVREITVAVRESGDDPKSNPRLRLAMEKANRANVTKDSIKRAIDKGGRRALLFWLVVLVIIKIVQLLRCDMLLLNMVVT